MTAVLDIALLLADVRALVAEPAQPGHGDDDAAVRDRLAQVASGPPGCGCPRRPPGREVSLPARLVPGRPATAPSVEARHQPPGSLPVPAVGASRYPVAHLLLRR